MADVPVRFAGLRGTLAAFAVDLFAGRIGALTDAPMCSGGYDRWGIYDGAAWRLGVASDYAGNANVLSLRVNGAEVIDSAQNVKGATVYTGGAIRVDGNGDFTGRNQALTGTQTVAQGIGVWGGNPATWAVGPSPVSWAHSVGKTCALVETETVLNAGKSFFMAVNWKYDPIRGNIVFAHQYRYGVPS